MNNRKMLEQTLINLQEAGSASAEASADLYELVQELSLLELETMINSMLGGF